MNRPARYLVVGTGWRAQCFLRLASKLADVELVGVVVRRSVVAEETKARWQVPAYLSLTEALSELRPDFVVISVPWAVAPGLITTAAEEGFPVLVETPPAPDIDGLRALWADVGATGLVQVAEQYLLYPSHAARLALVRQGVIGQPTSVQVSSTHGYHAVSMIRGLLGAGFAPATVRARAFKSPLVDPLTRDGWTGNDTAHEAETVIATLEFGGAMGLYDFTTNQWHNHLRARRIVIRGSRGEIVDDSVVRLAGERTIIQSSLVRRQTGYDLNLDGYDTDHISFNGQVVYRNPFQGLRLADDEIAVSSLLVAVAAWCRDEGPPPYPLAEGSQDHLVSLAIGTSLQTDAPVTTTTEKWAS
jgi:predicted dehydrogenase